MTATRRLAAILAADVAGYSAAMERDEEGTAAAVRALRREVIEPKLAEHQGRLIKTTGDGFLAEFASPIAALNCALAIQQQPTDSVGLQLRIGLNLGDVIIEEGGDVLGEGVNIAARLEGLADPGGILISSKIYSEVEGKVQAAFEDRGEQQVKNITKPVWTYAVRTGTFSSGRPGAALEVKMPALPDRPSIAVLPFQNMSGDPEQDYFADGMVEDIITALSRFKSLFVIARNSSFTYKGRAVDIKQVGRDLGVRYVLEGSVRKVGGRVRITGQLIDAATNAHLWADKFDGALQEVFDFQDKIAEQVVVTIVPKVRNAEIDRLERKRPDNLDAYDHVLRAQALLPAGPTELPAALVHLEKAIQLVPRYAFAHALLAHTYANLYVAGANSNLEEERRKALNFARRAAELGTDDPEALASASYAYGNFGDTETARFLAERAVDLNPNLAFGWFMVGSISLYTGGYEKALDCQARALRLSPVGAVRAGFMASTALAYLLLGQHDQAYLWAERAYHENPKLPFAVRVLAMSAAVAGNRARAHTIFQQFATAAPAYLERVKGFMHGNSDFEKIVGAMRLASIPDDAPPSSP